MVAIDLLFLFCFRMKMKIMIVLESRIRNTMSPEVDIEVDLEVDLEIIEVSGEDVMEVGAVSEAVAVIEMIIGITMVMTGVVAGVAGVVLEVVIEVDLEVVEAVGEVSTIEGPGTEMITIGVEVVQGDRGVTENREEVAVALEAVVAASIRESRLIMELHKIKRSNLTINES